MNRGLSILFVAASLIVLAGCTISGGGGGGGTTLFPGESVETVSVQPDFDSPAVDSNTLSSGESQVYRVDISSSVAQNNDVVYIDALTTDPARTDGYLEVLAYTISGGQAVPLYASTTDAWFGRANDPGLAALSASSEFSPTAIEVDPGACGGPCILLETPSSSSTAYFRVTGLQGTTSYELYVVATDFSDLAEPNDTFGAAESVNIAPGTTSAHGAIETIGDIDWFVTNSGISNVFFDPTAGNNRRLRAQVYESGGAPIQLLFPGDSVTINPPRVVRVEVYSDEDQQRAGAAGEDSYFIDFTQ